jgi:hypothetical protein
MADRQMTQNAAARFLAARPATKSATENGPQAQCPACGAFVPLDAQYAPATCPNCSVVLPVDPKKAARGNKGKPSARPWRIDKVFLEGFADAIARHAKAAFDNAVAPLIARVAALETELAALKAKRAKARPQDDVSLSHRDAAGELIAEFWQHGNVVCLRIGGKRTKQAALGSNAAAKLLAEFEGLAP